MAIDTRRKRASVVNVARPWTPPAIVPDGSFTQADRQHIGWSYAGLAAEPPGGVVAEVFLLPLLGIGRVA